MDDQSDGSDPKIQIEYEDGQVDVEVEILREAVQQAANDPTVSFVIEDWNDDDSEYLLRFEVNGKIYSAWFTPRFIEEVFGEITTPRFLIL